MIYYFVEFAGSFANIALLVLFVDRLFQKKDLSSRWFYLYIALLIVGQCILSLFPTWVMPRTIYLLLGGFLLAILFYEVQIWQAIFASATFFTLIAVVEVLAMLLIGLRIPDTEILMQAGAARLIYVVFSNLIQIPLLILISHFFSRKENVLCILWLLPIIVIQIASIAVCYVVQYHAADENFPDYLIGLMAVLLLMSILIVFYVEALRKNEQEKFRAKFNEQQYCLLALCTVKLPFQSSRVIFLGRSPAEGHLPGIIQAKECMKKKKPISEDQHYLCEIGLEKMPYRSSWLFKSYTEETFTHITIAAYYNVDEAFLQAPIAAWGNLWDCRAAHRKLVSSVYLESDLNLPFGKNGKFLFQLGYTPVVSDMKKIVQKTAALSFPKWALAVWDMDTATLYMVKYDRSH